MKKKNSNKKTMILIIKAKNRKLAGIFYIADVIPIIFQSYIILNIREGKWTKKIKNKK
jgi:hypothetical protein